MHEFESGFFVHQPAWHGLGTVLDDAPNIETAIIKAGLDWKVLERPLFTDNQEFDGKFEVNKPLNVIVRLNGEGNLQNVLFEEVIGRS